MAARKPKPKPTVQVENYDHPAADNATRPEVGTQARFTHKEKPKTYRYDSSLSPSLEWDGQNPAREEAETLIRQVLDAASLEEAKAAAEKMRRMSGAFLNWAGKAEQQSFDVPTLPLFIHERLSTKAIMETLRTHRRAQQGTLFDLFSDPQHAIVDQHLCAYEHRDPWVNRLILGDNLPVMNSLIHLEKMAGQVQMIYMDPPYGIKFGSNFQPFVRRRDVKHNDDDDLTREPEMVQAYRDTWDIGLHSYLTYMRDRLLLCRELLAPSGSVFVQISDDNLHHVREIMDEVFGPENFLSIITVRKTTSEGSTFLGATADFLICYARDAQRTKFRPIYLERSENAESRYDQVMLPDGKVRAATPEEKLGETALPKGARLFRLDNLTSSRPAGGGDLREFVFEGQKFTPGKGTFKTDEAGMQRIASAHRLQATSSGGLSYRRFADDFGMVPVSNLWMDISGAVQSRSDPKIYVVQTSSTVIQRCMLMTTDPGDLVLDPTCGSGTTAYVAEQWGRRWITIDVSRVPVALTRQRLLTATFPWYGLKDEARGPACGFVYKRKQNRRGEEVGGIVPHVTLKSIANNEPPAEEILVDRPEMVKDIIRVTGPFTFEAIIAPPAEMQDGASDSPTLNGERGYQERMLEVLRHSPRLHLPGNRTVEFSGLRVPARTQWLSAEASLINGKSEPVAVVFGPEHGAISDRLVYNAAVEARAKQYVLLVVVGFAVEANARRMIDACLEMCGVPAVYVQATMDLMMGDLLKNMRSSQILSVCGSPEIKVQRLPALKGEAPKYQVTLLGLDVFNPVTMEVHHRDGSDVPAWFLCTDYNDRVFHITQAFFPRTGAWDNLKRSLKGVYDDSLWQHLAGTTSAPFEAGEHNQIAVKVIDDRGNELLVVRNLAEAEQAEPQPQKMAKETPIQPSVARITKRRGRKS